MNFDLINNIITELTDKLCPARVSKIYQPGADIVIFKLWNGRENFRLLISSEINKSRIHLTEREWLNPNSPPRFCQLLRSRITRIDHFELVNNDRIVQFHCSGHQGPTRLVVEFTGRSSNMILTNADDIIIDLLKRVEGETGRRALMPGVRYVVPDKTAATGQTHERGTDADRGERSWNQFVENLYTDGEHSENQQDFATQLQQTVSKHIKKLSKRLSNISAELKKQTDFIEDKHKAELILSHLHHIKRGMETVSLLNYFQQPPENLVVALDPLLNPQQNAERYFKRYKKSRRGIEHSQRRLEETQTELDWLAQLDYQLQDSVKNSDIEEIAQELREAGLLKEHNKLHLRRTQQPAKIRETISPSGFRILWGRNNRQNDELSTKLLKTGDLWFHVQHAPGAHVIMKCSEAKLPVSAEDILYAASLAAGYSQCKNDAKVEVICAEGQSIHKPKGSRPGLVTVKQYKTHVVKPVRIDL